MNDGYTLNVLNAIAHNAILTQVGDGLYRIDEELGLSMAAVDEEEASLFPQYGDTIAAHIDKDGTLIFDRVHERGQYQRLVYVLDATTIRSPGVVELLKEISRVGGCWGTMMGGVLSVSIPNSSEINLSARLHAAIHEA
jgi:hypothetical protein